LRCLSSAMLFAFSPFLCIHQRSSLSRACVSFHGKLSKISFNLCLKIFRLSTSFHTSLIILLILFALMCVWHCQIYAKLIITTQKRFTVYGGYNCHNSRHSSCLLFKIRCFGNWILSPSSGWTYSYEPNRKS
jgi:hypothetical protein